MIYVIGKDKLDWAKVDKIDNIYINEKGDTVCDRTFIKVIVGGPQNQATFFNNKCDAVEMLENIKKYNVKIEAYLPIDENPVFEDLKIITLKAEIDE